MKQFNNNIIDFCSKKNNRLCIGLDIDNEKLNNQSITYMKDFIFDIIDNTIDHCPIYKINFAIVSIILNINITKIVINKVHFFESV